MRRLACAVALLALAACSPKKDSPAATLDRVEVTPPSPSIPAGTSAQLRATAVWSDGRTADVTEDAAWSSSAGTVVEVSNVAGTKGLARGLAAGAATITATYQGVSGTAAATGVVLALVSIEVTPTAPSVPKGQDLQLTATATYQGGATFDVTASATWTSGATGFATVSDAAGTKGRVHAVAEGSATVTAELGGISGSTDVAVTAAVLASVRVDAVRADLPVGASTALAATAVFSDASELDVTASAAWAAAPQGVVSLDASGGVERATALAVGTATVTATYQGRTGSSDVSVHAAALEAIAITPASPATVVNGTVALTAMGTYAGGEAVDVTALATWSSLAPLVATVSNAAGTKGVVTGHQSGSATITAAFGGATGTANVLVTSLVAAGVRVEPAAITVAPGRTTPLRAFARAASGDEVEVTGIATWHSDATGVATVSTGGVLSGVTLGATTVSAAFSGKMGAANVLVEAPYPVALLVAPDAYTATSAGVGATGRLVARAAYSDGTVREVTPLCAWISDAPGVVSVSTAPGSKGVVVAVAPGTAHVGAAFAGLAADVTFTVVPMKVQWLVLSYPPSPLPVGVTQRLTATAVLDDWTSEDVTALATWSASGGAATVDAAGIATTVAAGATVVTASYGGVSASTLVTVTGVAPTGLTFSPSRTTLVQGDYTWWSARLTYPNNVQVPVDTGVQLVSTNTAVMDVWSVWDLEPVPHAVAPGTAVVEAHYAGLVASQTFTVTAVTGLSLSLPSGIALGATVRGWLSAQNASSVNLADEATWSSSDTSVVTVTSTGGANEKGWVTAVGAGSATITATYAGLTATRVVTVRPRAITITVSPATAEIQRYAPPYGSAGYQDFTATANLADGSTLDVTTDADWTCDWNVASPGYLTGQVTASNPGRTFVTASYGGAAGSAILTVVRGAPSMFSVWPSANAYWFPRGVTVEFSGLGSFSGLYDPIPSGITWSSSNPDVASFSADPAHEGELTTSATVASPASTVITASYLGTAESGGGHTVNVADPLSVAAVPAALTVPVGGGTPVEIRGTFPNGLSTATFDLGPWVTWSVVDGAAAGVASGGTAGLPFANAYVYGLRPGTTVLRATLGTWSTDLPVTVTLPTVTSLALTLPAAPPYVGVETPLGAVATLSSGEQVDVSALATFTSTNTAVAEVVGPPPALAALAAGTTTITAAWGGKTVSQPVTVTDAYTGMLVFSPPVVSIPVGGSGSTYLQPPSTASYDNAHVGTEAVVTASNATVAEVTNTSAGVYIRGLAPGTSLVTATYRGQTVQALVNVYAEPGALDPLGAYGSIPGGARLTMHPGERMSMYALASGPTPYVGVFPDQGAVPGAAWTSSNPAVARIISGSVVEGVSPGVATATVSLGGSTSSTFVVVSGATLLGLEQPPVGLALPIGAEFALHAYANYTDGTSEIGYAASWSSSDPAVAELVAGKVGVIRGKAAGTALVEASYGGFTMSVPVTVF